MTDLLKSVMQERVERSSTPQPDITAILASGERRARRRRWTGAVGGVAALVMAATAATFAADRLTGPDIAVAPTGQPPFQARQVSYAVGSTINYGSRSIDVGDKVASYVQTDFGFVFATKDGEVYFADGERVSSIGRTSPDGLYLKADDSGPLAAWVEFPEGAAPEFVVHDTATGDEVLRTSEGNDVGMGAFRDTDAAYVYAVDGEQVYVHSGRGAEVYDASTGDSRTLDEKAVPFTVSDVADGVIARLDNRDGEGTITIGRGWSDQGTTIPASGQGYLSPAGAYFSVEDADVMRVFDTSTGNEVDLPVPGYAFKVVYQWLDDDTAVLVALDSETGPFDILTCDIPTGSCSVAVEDAATFPNFALPVGQSLG